MSGKLHIDLEKGIINIEGNEALQKEVYEDFKERLLKKAENPAPVSSPPTKPSESPKVARKPPPKKSDAGKPRAAEYSPSLVKSLDTNGCVEFFEQFVPKNNAERILIFLKFLESKLETASFTADQVYTCFKIAKQRQPEAFLQAFRDAQGRNYGYIDYSSPDDIKITLIGENHFSHDLRRKADDK